MVKTKGSRDKVRFRKRRSDKGKKREKYAGKKTKPRRKINGKFVSYVSKRRREDPIKVWFWSVHTISNEGLMNFHRSVRRKMHKSVYGRNRLRVDLYPEMISTKEGICEIAIDNLSEGTWLLKLWSHSKNRFHCSAKAFAVIKITDHPEGMKCKVIPNYKRRSLRRLWFWRDK